MTQFNDTVKSNKTLTKDIVSVMETIFPLSISTMLTNIRVTTYTNIVKSYSSVLATSDNVFNYNTDIIISPKVNKLITKLATNVSFDVMKQKTQLLIQYKLVNKRLPGSSKYRIVAMVTGAGLFCNYFHCDKLLDFIYSAGLSDNKVHSPLYYINKSEYFQTLTPTYRLVSTLINHMLTTHKVYYSGGELSKVLYHETVNSSFEIKSGLLVLLYKTFDFVTTLKYNFLYQKGTPPIELILSNLYIGEKHDF